MSQLIFLGTTKTPTDYFALAAVIIVMLIILVPLGKFVINKFIIFIWFIRYGYPIVDIVYETLNDSSIKHEFIEHESKAALFYMKHVKLKKELRYNKAPCLYFKKGPYYFSLVHNKYEMQKKEYEQYDLFIYWHGKYPYCIHIVQQDDEDILFAYGLATPAEDERFEDELYEILAAAKRLYKLNPNYSEIKSR